MEEELKKLQEELDIATKWMDDNEGKITIEAERAYSNLLTKVNDLTILAQKQAPVVYPMRGHSKSYLPCFMNIRHLISSLGYKTAEKLRNDIEYDTRNDFEKELIDAYISGRTKCTLK